MTRDARRAGITFLHHGGHAHTNRCWWNHHEARMQCPGVATRTSRSPKGADRDHR